MAKYIVILSIVVLGFFSLAACSSAGSQTGSDAQPSVGLNGYHASAQPTDPLAIPAAKAQLAYLADLSNGVRDGVVFGQNLGHGDQILDMSGLVGYESLVASLERQTGELPGMIGVDYEHDQIFTPAQLSAANRVLSDFAAKGGLVTINWAPHSPWLNDESNIAAHPGKWGDTRTKGNDNRQIDLRLLVDPNSAIHAVWHRKLDRIATALLELQRAGVVVLWRPLQEMDGDWFWWGTASHPNDPSPYVAVWRDMYRYFGEKGLHNVLWVFSPSMHESHPINWLYPGDGFVDIVAGTTYQDQLLVRRYADLLQFNKVVGLAELGPQSWRGWQDVSGSDSLNGSFDTLLYARRLLVSYPSAAYWVCWHNWPNGDGTSEHQALVSNRNAAELLQNPLVITLSRLAWR